MDRSLRFRTVGLAAIVVFCVLYLMPTFVDSTSMPSWFSHFFSKKITLGLDLQGGAQFIYSIDLDTAVDDKASDIRRDIEAKLEEKGVKAAVSTPAIAAG